MITKPFSMKSFADFVCGTDAAKAKIVKNYKYPNDESRAMARYYHPAKSAIINFNNDRHSKDFLLDKALELDKKSLTLSKSQRTKCLSNSKAIRNYAAHFSDEHFDILKNDQFRFTINGLIINVTPDLHILEGGNGVFVKYNFSTKKLKSDFIDTILDCMSYGLSTKFSDYPSESVALMDLNLGRRYYGHRSADQTHSNLIRYSTELIQMWDSI